MSDYTQGARVYHDTAQSIPTGTATALAFNSTRWDTDDIHDPVTNNSRLTCKTAGKYLIAAAAAFVTEITTGLRSIAIKLNGTTNIILVSWNRNQNGPTRMDCATIWDMSVGDYVEVIVEQTWGGDLNIEANPNHSPEFMMHRIG